MNINYEEFKRTKDQGIEFQNDLKTFIKEVTINKDRKYARRKLNNLLDPIQMTGNMRWIWDRCRTWLLLKFNRLFPVLGTIIATGLPNTASGVVKRITMSVTRRSVFSPALHKCSAGENELVVTHDSFIRVFLGGLKGKTVDADTHPAGKWKSKNFNGKWFEPCSVKIRKNIWKIDFLRIWN